MLLRRSSHLFRSWLNLTPYLQKNFSEVAANELLLTNLDEQRATKGYLSKPGAFIMNVLDLH